MPLGGVSHTFPPRATARSAVRCDLARRAASEQKVVRSEVRFALIEQQDIGCAERDVHIRADLIDQNIFKPVRPKDRDPVGPLQEILHDIVAVGGAEGEDVGPTAARQDVVALAAFQPVIAAAALDDVVVPAAEQAVIAYAAKNSVVSALATDDIVARQAVCEVAEETEAEIVIARQKLVQKSRVIIGRTG